MTYNIGLKNVAFVIELNGLSTMLLSRGNGRMYYARQSRYMDAIHMRVSTLSYHHHIIDITIVTILPMKWQFAVFYYLDSM